MPDGKVKTINVALKYFCNKEHERKDNSLEIIVDYWESLKGYRSGLIHSYQHAGCSGTWLGPTMAYVPWSGVWKTRRVSVHVNFYHKSLSLTLPISLCMCVLCDTCVYVHICIWLCEYICVCTCVVYMCMCESMCICMCMYMCIH